MLFGTRQIIDYDVYYGKYEFLNQMIDLWNVFCNDSIELALEDVSFHSSVKPLIKAMEVGLKRSISDKVKYIDTDVETYGFNSGKQIVVAFSGGKDSLATAIKYKSLGYDCKLFNLHGINKGFPGELNAARKLADKLDLSLFVEEVKLKGKKFYVEHPLKNQIICTFALVYCLENNIDTHIVFGDFKTDTYQKSHYGLDWSDCFEVWEAYEQFMRTWVKDFKVDISFDVIDDSYEVMSNNPEYIEDYQSCLMTIKYRNSLNKHNIDKYKVVDMLPNRCGSCWKCAMEYIYYADKGVQKYNRDYYKHCLNVLKDKFPSAKAELPKPKCMRDIYEGYFCTMKYYTDSAYYKDTKEK